MRSSSLAIWGFTLTGSFVTAQAAPSSSPAIEWFSCPQNESTVAPYECGTLEVPLDYTDPTAGTLGLKMVRVNHTKDPFMGSILFNAGGPGLASRSLVAGAGGLFLELTGGHFDLIAHDPRGTGDTIPYVCYNATDRSTSALVTPFTTDTTDTAPGVIHTSNYLRAEACIREQGNHGALVGTAFTARDMMQIVDALGEDGLLRYWGFSYGSALGATAAAMFPDRMDKVVIDGVVNLRQYYSGVDIEQVLKTDAGFRAFLEACIDGDGCVLSEDGSSADELEGKVYDLFNATRYQPLALGTTIGDVVDYGSLKSNVLTGLRQPLGTWPFLAEMLHGIFTRNLTAYREAAAVLQGLFYTGSWPDYGLDGPAGIRCSDHSFRTDSLTDVLPIIDELEQTSEIAGGLLAAGQLMVCAQWPFKAKEQIEWTGGYKTKNPILIVGNTFDPLTPVESAFNTSLDFPGSVVIHQNTGGHASIGHASTCTQDAIRSYFVNGTLPEYGLLCEPDEPLGAFTPAEGNMSKRALMSEDHARLLDTTNELGRRMYIG